MNCAQQNSIAEVLATLAQDAELQKQSTVADELPNLESFVKMARHQGELCKNLRFLDYHLSLTGLCLHDLQVLDVGSGLGMNTLVFSMLAGRAASGIEKSEHLFGISRALMRKAPDAVRPCLYHGDVVDMPFADQTFNLVCCFEALSHFRYPEKALREMARVCRPNGVLVISDGNNARNRSLRTRTLAYWRHFEFGPSHASTSDGYHYVDTAYADMRRDIIARAHPGLSEEDREKLVEGTFGYNQAETLAAVKRRVQSGEWPSSRFDGSRVPVDPVKDDVRENLFDPLALCRDLEPLGFEARPYPYFGAARNAPLALANRLLSRLVSPRWTLPCAKLFIVVARKR